VVLQRCTGVCALFNNVQVGQAVHCTADAGLHVHVHVQSSIFDNKRENKQAWVLNKKVMVLHWTPCRCSLINAAPASMQIPAQCRAVMQRLT
jgi:hypothetical protein